MIMATLFIFLRKNNKEIKIIRDFNPVDNSITQVQNNKEPVIEEILKILNKVGDWPLQPDQTGKSNPFLSR